MEIEKLPFKPMINWNNRSRTWDVYTRIHSRVTNTNWECVGKFVNEEEAKLVADYHDKNYRMSLNK